MSPFYIIDTNVVVAGLLTSRADSPVARILDGMLSAAFVFVVSEALLAEYRAVLVRPKLCKLHGLSAAEIDIILTDMARHAIVLSPVRTAASPMAPDAGDQFLWDMLAARADLVLVTGDKLLLHAPAMLDRVISPQTCVVRLQH
jgi:putative PIN family toxin of toxin-antitoxin system